MYWRYLIILVFLGFMTFQFSESLMCYQCANTVLNSPCYHDYEGLTNTSRGRNDTYKKNCTDSNSRWDRCVIETHIAAGGNYILFKRGCHDGQHFPKDIDDLEFHNLTANNYTTCAHPKLKLVCFTFCDTDYCNGPQPIYTECEKEFYANKTIPDDVFCGGYGIHDNCSGMTLVAMVVIVMALSRFGHVLQL